jgi:hypothetical protein
MKGSMQSEADKIKASEIADAMDGREQNAA